MTEVSSPQHIGHGCGIQRQARVAAFGLLHGINGEKANGIDALGIEIHTSVPHKWLLPIGAPVLGARRSGTSTFMPKQAGMVGGEKRRRNCLAATR